MAVQAAVEEDRNALLLTLTQGGSFEVMTKETDTSTITVKQLQVTDTDATGLVKVEVPVEGAAVSLPASLVSSLSEALGGEMVAAVTVYDSSAIASQGNGSGIGDVQAMMSIDLFSMSDASALSGLDGFSEPVLFSMPLPEVNVTPGFALKCAYWDETLADWSFEGVETLDATANSISCATRHLSLFGAILAELEALAICSNAEVMTPAGLSKIARFGPWLYRPTFIGVLLVFFAHLAFLVVGILRDKQDKKCEQFTDRFFLTTDPAFEKHKSTCSKHLKEVFSDEFHDVQRHLEHDISTIRTKQSPLMVLVSSVFSKYMIFLSRYNAAATGNVDLKTLKFIQKRTKKTDKYHRQEDSLRPSQQSGNDELTNSNKNKHLSATFKSCHELPESFAGDDHFSQLSKSVDEQVHLWHGKLDDNPLAFPRQFLNLFRTIHPLSTLLQRNLLISRSVRAMLAMAKSFGALGSSAFFFVASGSAFSDASDPRCNTQGVIAALVRNVSVGIISFIIAGLPIIILVSLHGREMTYVLTNKEAEKQLKIWKIKNAVVWCTGVFYTLFCLLYVVSFQANIGPVDSLKWGTSATATLLQSWVLVPAILAFSMAAFGRLAVASPAIHPVSKKALRSEHKLHGELNLDSSSQDDSSSSSKNGAQLEGIQIHLRDVFEISEEKLTEIPEDTDPASASHVAMYRVQNGQQTGEQNGHQNFRNDGSNRFEDCTDSTKDLLEEEVHALTEVVRKKLLRYTSNEEFHSRLTTCSGSASATMFSVLGSSSTSIGRQVSLASATSTPRHHFTLEDKTQTI